MNYVVSCVHLCDNRMLMCEVQAIDKVAALIAGVSSLMEGCGYSYEWLDSVSENLNYLGEDEQLMNVTCELFEEDVIAGVLRID